MNKHFKFLFFVVGSFFSLQLSAQFYYGSQQEFGKNRVQYQPFDWTVFYFDRYQVYLYEGGQEIAKYVAVSMKKNLEDLEKRLDFQSEEKMQVLVYNNYHDFIQSNIGLAADEQQGNIGGVTKIAGTKMGVCFNGSHRDLDKQIRQGISEVLINQMLFGGRARDVVKNSTLLTVPDWFRNGLISYYGENWNFEMDSRVLDAVENDRFLKFNRLTGDEAKLAGHAFWNYIAETYGEAVIPNILYMTKVGRSVENAFEFVLATTINQLTNEWMESYLRRTVYADSLQYLPKDKPVFEKVKPGMIFFNPKLSPDATQLVYCTNEMGQNKAYLYNLETKKKKRLFRSGPRVERLNDYSYPLVAWHPNGNLIGIITEKKNQLVLITIDLENKEKYQRNITGFEKITDFSYSPDGKKLIFSGVKKGKGQSDLFVFTIASAGLEQLTNDIYDDMQACFVNNGKQIAFCSNRPNDTLKNSDDAKYYYTMNKENDLFMMDYPTGKKVLYRVTHTEYVDESYPTDAGNGFITYLSESNGIRNNFSARLDSVIAFVDTTEHYRYTFHQKAMSNYKRNIIQRDVNARHTATAEIFYLNGLFRMYIRPVTEISSGVTPKLQNTYFRRNYNYLMKNASYNNTVEGNNEKNNLQNTNEKQDSTAKPQETVQQKNANPYDPLNFRIPIQQNYYVNFSTDYVVTQLDNSFLSVQYQRFTGGGSPVYINPGLNALLKIGLSDVFEDYRIVGGVRFSSSLDNEFLLSWENRKKLWDKQLILHRQGFVSVANGAGGLMKVHTHDVQYKWRYPFSEVLSARIGLIYRNDRRTYLATDDANLNRLNEFDNMGGTKVEFILDNTIKKGINLYNGFRGKIFGEYYRFVQEKRRDLITFGFDFRHYQKIHRDLIWCNRLAGGGSLGTDRLIYYLGGIDSWLRPKFDNSINIVNPNQYAFQTLATNMRGFKQNIRNGNNFVVFNSELRWPIFRYLFNRPIKTDFFNNFQIVAFGDIGSAWYGWNPYSADNTQNTNVYGAQGNPVQVTLFKQKEPIVGGFGTGVRSRIFGYFVRLDFAWGVDDWVVKKGMTMLSFCTDF